MRTERNETYGYKRIIADEGMMLSQWNKDKDEIEDFVCKEEMYMPLFFKDEDMFEYPADECRRWVKMKEYLKNR